MNQISQAWSLNSREAWKAFFLTILSAVLIFVWESSGTFITEAITHFHFDTSLFTSAVNWTTIWNVAVTAASTYLGITIPAGKKKNN